MIFFLTCFKAFQNPRDASSPAKGINQVMRDPQVSSTWRLSLNDVLAASPHRLRSSRNLRDPRLATGHMSSATKGAVVITLGHVKAGRPLEEESKDVWQKGIASANS